MFNFFLKANIFKYRKSLDVKRKPYKIFFKFQYEDIENCHQIDYVVRLHQQTKNSAKKESFC